MTLEGTPYREHTFSPQQMRAFRAFTGPRCGRPNRENPGKIAERVRVRFTEMTLETLPTSYGQQVCVFVGGDLL